MREKKDFIYFNLPNGFKCSQCKDIKQVVALAKMYKYDATNVEESTYRNVRTDIRKIVPKHSIVIVEQPTFLNNVTYNKLTVEVVMKIGIDISNARKRHKMGLEDKDLENLVDLTTQLENVVKRYIETTK